MADYQEWDVAQIARQARQRLESLRRAGVASLPLRTQEAASLDVLVQMTEAQMMAADSPVAPRDEPLELSGSESHRDSAMIPNSVRASALEVLKGDVSVCVRCAALAQTRTQTVFGEGSPSARLMFIGEAPGFDEDRTGRPFVGRAGQLLTDMITKGMRLKREEVYIANILKCRPPDNRVPLADEVAHCRGYLETQIDLIQPEFLCLLGKTAAAALLDTTLALGKLRGRWFLFRDVKTLVTYHPAYLLRNPASKRDAWEDLKLLMAEMGMPLASG